MRAARIVEQSPGIGHEAVVPEAIADNASVLRVASDLDMATTSPVHALHAQLAEALDPPPPLRFDPRRIGLGVLAALYTAGAWWGLVSVGSVLVHHWTGR
jgi:hypothetical protein